MSLTRNQIILIGAGVFVVIGLLLVFIFGARRTGEELSGPLIIWGVFDDADAFSQSIGAYKKIHPKADISYRQFDPLTYEKDLINALAGGRGPDIFMFHNTWLPKHFDKIWPISNQLSLTRFRQLFPTVAEQDFAPDGIIYALPLYIDTLAMFYNKDLFDAAGIALPPKNWQEFQNLVPKLRQLDKTGRITRAAAAIGGSNDSINRAADLLNLLMLQAGIPMVTDDFSSTDFYPDGVESLKFYTQFANPAGSYYTWNENLPYSLDSFAEEGAAIIFNYAYQIPFIKEKNPFLNFAIAPMPQPTETSKIVNWANYWGLAVSAKTQNPQLAFDFAINLTTNPQMLTPYLSAAKRPPAVRSLIAQYQNDSTLGVFVKQALTARSWPQIDSAAITDSFSNMIKSINSGRRSPERALAQAAEEIDELMRRRTR
jgi:multiple sugar transport system substrate-binding protein